MDSQAYSDLWLAWTYQRLSQPLPETLLARASAAARGEWPRPALAVLAGRLSPEEMLKLLERKSGDQRRMATLEGYFYLGQFYIGRGDKAKAREFFEKTRELNIVSSMEHKAAGFELNYLGPGELLSHEATPARAIPTGSLPSAAAEGPPATPPAAADSVPPKAKAQGQKPPRKAQGSWGLWKLW